ncbi:thioredoxin family protein [candidate division KSB1 bacterium]|nr:thioredoxin family protein [candidate division KSB1 bacterium]
MKIHTIILKFVFISFLLVFSFSCQQNEETPKTEKNGILKGWITENQLFELSPVYVEEKNSYQPDSASISFLKKFNEELNIQIFLGTWCPDCRREVPRFLKVMEKTDNDFIKFQMMGLDRTKRDSLGLAEKFQIEFVPTFIVLQKNREIGRIIEIPMLSIEQDLVEILLKLKNE